MKAQILKIAGVKSEKEFYKKYKTEAAFMKVHGKAFKKAQTSNAINKAQGGWGAMTPGGSNDWQNQGGLPSNNVGAGDQQGVFLSDQEVANKGGMYDGYSDPQNAPGQKGAGFNVPGAMNFIGSAINAGEGIKAAEDTTKLMTTWANVSDVQKRAKISNVFAPKQPNQWYRGDDPRNIHSSNELANVEGRGTDVFNVQNGGGIGGNPTEIQNTYDGGNDIYTDLEDPHNIKAYQGGGGFGNLFGGGDTKPFLGGSALGKGGLFGGDTSGNSMVTGAMGGNSSWANAASIIPGPLGMAATMAAGYFDPNPGRQRSAQNRMNSNYSYIDNLNTSENVTGGLSNMGVGQNGEELMSYEEGGYMNPEYNPQVITMFGDHNAEDFADYAHKYRAGGHLKEYTPPSERAMETYENGGEMSSYAMGGKLQTHWGGNANDRSYNPHMPGSGESVLLHGASHNDDGIGISYGNEAQNGYEYAANGANGKAQIEAEDGESMMEMPNGGQIDPQTGEEETNAVVIGNIPAKYDVLSLISDNKDLLGYLKKKGNDGRTMKSLFANLTKDEIAANKAKEKASKIANSADKDKWGKLDLQTAQTIEGAADADLQAIANTKIGMAEAQDILHKIKGQISQARGKNISAEALGRGQIKDDLDPITKNAPLAAKFGASLRKAQNMGELSGGSGAGGQITEEEYNQFLKEYADSEAADKKAKGKTSDPTLAFQRHYHKAFPKEALAAIQKTTRENGLSNRAKQLGLTKEEILKGENIDKILQSNEDAFYGPRTKQYLASVKSNFTKTPPAAEMKTATLGVPTNVAADTAKQPIGVVPLKKNNALDAMGMIASMFQNRNFPPMDPRQFAGENVASSLNVQQPVPMQKPSVQLDPMYRINYNDVRNANTAALRDVLRQGEYNPVANSLMLGKFAQQNQGIGGEEFRANQAIEQQVYGGNRAKVAANQDKALALNANQANLQSIAKSKTDQTNIEIAKSRADKNMKYTADKNRYMVNRNLFPKFGYDQGYGIHTQGPGYNPVIPQIYGEKSTIQEVPVYDTDGKTILRYKMIDTSKEDTDSVGTPPFVPAGRTTKNGGSVVKNAKNGSVVKAYKNL
jgi:hypothetical protein